MKENAPERTLLCELADAWGVATEYWGFDGNKVMVSDLTLIRILASLGVDASNEPSARRALEEARMRPWRETLPACTVVRDDRESRVAVHLPHGAGVTVEVELENGGARALAQGEDFTPPREVSGVLTGQASFVVPARMPLGYHMLRARITLDDGSTEVHGAPFVVVPQRLASPAERGMTGWGMTAQLYSVRSRRSWGVGDTADLKEMCSLFGAMGADFILINPLHAAEPVGHITPSPYLPVTRRFFNPLYVRPEDVHEVAYMPAAQRALVTWAGEEIKETDVLNEVIDRDSSWEAKLQALEVIFAFGRSKARQRDFERFRATEGQGLEDFALWCALRERYGEDFPKSSPRPPLRTRRSSGSSWPRGSISSPGFSGSSTPSSRTPSGKPSTRAWRWASSTTWPSACTPRARTCGPTRGSSLRG